MSDNENNDDSEPESDHPKELNQNNENEKPPISIFESEIENKNGNESIKTESEDEDDSSSDQSIGDDDNDNNNTPAPTDDPIDNKNNDIPNEEPSASPAGNAEAAIDTNETTEMQKMRPQLRSIGYSNEDIDRVLTPESALKDIQYLVNQINELKNKSPSAPPKLETPSPPPPKLETPPPHIQQQPNAAENNPYLDNTLLNALEEFSPKQNERFVNSHKVNDNINNNNNNDNDDGNNETEPETSSSEQEISNDEVIEIEEVEQEVDDDDDDDVIGMVSPKIRMSGLKEGILEGIRNKSNIIDIQNKMNKYDILYNDENKEENDWDDFAVEENDEDEITLLQYAFKHENFNIVLYLLQEKQCDPSFDGKHCIFIIIDAIIADFKNNMTDHEIKNKYALILECAIRTLKPHFIEESFNIILRLMDSAFSFQSDFMCKHIEYLLTQTMDNGDRHIFIDSLNENKFGNILQSLYDNATQGKNDEMKKEIFTVLYKLIIKEQANYGWIFKCTKLMDIIFRDWEIFQIILTQTDRFNEHYIQYNPNITNTNELVWHIMNCMENNNPNMNGIVLICNYIGDSKPFYDDFLKDESINTLVLKVINANEMNKKVKKEYISALCYFFLDVERSLNFDNGIIYHILSTLNGNSQSKAIKSALYNIFICSMIGFGNMNKENNVNVENYFSIRTEEEKNIKNWMKNFNIGNTCLKKVIEKMIEETQSICKNVKRNFDYSIHSNVIIKLALRLSVFLGRINNDVREEEIIREIFMDNVDEMIYKGNTSPQTNYFSLQKLHHMVYKILRICFEAKHLQNVHVIFVPEYIEKSGVRDDEKASVMDDEEKKEIDDKIVNMHLMNVSILNGMSCKQIGEFVSMNFMIGYDYGDIGTYDDMCYMIYDNDNGKWDMVGNINDRHCLQGQDNGATVLLVMNKKNNEEEIMDVGLDIIIGHIHRYALMSMKKGDVVYYMADDSNRWYKGNVEVIGDNSDDKNAYYSIRGHKGVENYIFDVFDAKAANYWKIIPNKLTHWLPLNYFKNGEMDEYEWCKPHFTFISSFIMSGNHPVFAGHIKYNGQDKYHGAFDTVSGFIPYPNIHPGPPFINIESKLSINNFVNQFEGMMNDNYNYNNYNANGRRKHTWAKYTSWKRHTDEKMLHDFLLKDMNNVQMMTYSEKNCDISIYLFARKHLYKIMSMNKHRINFDFIRYGRDHNMDSQCFALIVFKGFEYYSSAINTRFSNVYLKDLNEKSPPFVYALPVVNDDNNNNNNNKNKNKNKNNKKKEKVRHYSKQANKQKAKKKKQELAKDWPLAMGLIEEWAKKNKNSLPKDTEKWESVIKTQIMPKLYPSFQGANDLEQLACRAASIDVSKFTDEEEEKQPPKKVKKPQHKKKNKPPQQINNNNNNMNRNDNNCDLNDFIPASIRTIDIKGVDDEKVLGIISHGSIFGVPSKGNINGNELMKLFTECENMLTSELFMGLQISTKYFIKINNWRDFENLDRNINGNTLFLYVRFTSRQHNYTLHLLEEQKNQLGFNVIEPVKKPKKNRQVLKMQIPKPPYMNNEANNNQVNNNQNRLNLPKFDNKFVLNFKDPQQLYNESIDNTYDRIVGNAFDQSYITHIAALKQNNNNNNNNNNMHNGYNNNQNNNQNNNNQNNGYKNDNNNQNNNQNNNNSQNNNQNNQNNGYKNDNNNNSNNNKPQVVNDEYKNNGYRNDNNQNNNQQNSQNNNQNNRDAYVNNDNNNNNNNNESQQQLNDEYVEGLKQAVDKAHQNIENMTNEMNQMTNEKNQMKQEISMLKERLSKYEKI